jgi:hypothetical protein
LPQGLGVGWSELRQLSDFAMIRALEVLPVPLAPVNRYAGAIRLVFKALLRVCAIASCPTRSAKICGRYLWCSGS